MPRLLVLVAAGALSVSLALAQPAPEAFAAPSLDAVRSQVIAWVAARNPPANIVEEVGRMWVFEQTPSPEELFEKAIASFGLVDTETRGFLDACRLVDAPLLPPESGLLGREDSPIYGSNMRLFYGRYLVHRRMYEEALDALAGLKPSDVIDPAALLFCRAVCQHQLQQKEEGLATVKQLLSSTESVPVRYATLATLMQYDLEQLNEKELDGISRKMGDVGRRLTLGRTGPKVQKKEAEIIASLDEIIKKIEEEQGGGQGQGGDGNNNSNRSTNPLNDSKVKGNTAPGLADSKKFSKDGAWGTLPPKDRPKAQDLISRGFPSHYEQAIQEFTKKQAAREAAAKK